MKLHEVIRQRRTAKGLTQEQVAERLGVSAPAVNKWERAVSCPDIALLPALARLLDTDLNTLLSFQDNLSDQEIGQFLNTLATAGAEQGVDAAVQLAADKVREYPSCGKLMLNAAQILEGLQSIYGGGDKLYDQVEQWYLRAAQDSDPQVSGQAKSMLISHATKDQDFERAQQLLSTLPDGNSFDKRQLQANLCAARGDWGEAARCLEYRLLLDVSTVQSTLFSLTEFAYQDGRASDAEQLAAKAEELTRLFDLWDVGVCVAQLQLGLLQKDTERCLFALKRLPSALTKGWHISQSPLYRHIQEKKGGQALGNQLLPQILADLENPDHLEYDFLRGEPEFQGFLASCKAIL